MKLATTLILITIRFSISSGINNPKRCTVRISELGPGQPLYLKPGTSSQWPISSSGNMELVTGDMLELFCPSTYFNPSGISGSQTATCDSGVNFKIAEKSYNIGMVNCSSWPELTTRKTLDDEECNGGKVFETGFLVGSRFVKQLELCFNEKEEVTRYVYHTLGPESKAFQSNVIRPTFSKGGLFGTKSLEKLYTKNSQIKSLSKAIGKINAEKYISKESAYYLARGHLAAMVDFITANEQRGTFLYANVAPQWQTFNIGNWNRVEDNTRNWVVQRNLHVNCWTGTYGITTLPNESGIETPLYLDFDKRLIPVPKLFFRVIIEPSTKRGVVLLGVNNPYLTLEQIEKDYILCNDVSDQLDFLTWKKKDLKAGYSYACEVNDFAKRNPYLPEFDVISLLK